MNGFFSFSFLRGLLGSLKKGKEKERRGKFPSSTGGTTEPFGRGRVRWPSAEIRDLCK